MVLTEIKFEKPKDKMYRCPICGSSRVRQKHNEGNWKFLCLKCYWHGTEPMVLDRPRNRHRGCVVQSVTYVEIIRNLLSGKSIAEQFKIFNVALGSPTDGRKTAIRNKILRVYAAYAEITGVPCNDPEFTKIKATPDVTALLKYAIEEEMKIRNAPRLSVTFGK